MTSDAIGLYLHIPFCTAKCGYCDFNSYAGHEHMIPSYTDTLLKDASLWARRVGGRAVETVFFGGGTPSLTPVDEMAKILDGLRATFAFEPDAEISLEANPGSLSTEYLRGLRGIGFNRLSIGVQSFDDDELRALDRIHSADEAREAYRVGARRRLRQREPRPHLRPAGAAAGRVAAHARDGARAAARSTSRSTR